MRQQQRQKSACNLGGSISGAEQRFQLKLPRPWRVAPTNPGPWARSAVFRGCSLHRGPLPAAVTADAGRPGGSGAEGRRRMSGQPTGFRRQFCPVLFYRPNFSSPSRRRRGRGGACGHQPPMSRGGLGCEGAQEHPTPSPRAWDPGTWTRGLM